MPNWRGPVRFRSCHSLEAASIGFDHARINGKAFTANETSIHAATHYRLEDMAEEVAVAKASMPVLAKGGVIGDLVFQSKLAKPAIGEVQRNVLAKPAL